VNSATESDVLAHVGAVHVKLIRALEPALVTVGGPEEKHEAAAGRDVDGRRGSWSAVPCGSLSSLAK